MCFGVALLAAILCGRDSGLHWFMLLTRQVRGLRWVHVLCNMLQLLGLPRGSSQAAGDRGASVAITFVVELWF